MRKGLLATIYVLFFLAVGGAVLAFNVQNKFISSSSFVKQSLAESGTYAKLVHISAKDLESMISDDNRDANSEMSTLELQKLISYVSPETLQSTAENTLDQAYNAFLNNKNTISIDLSRIKADVLAKQPAEISAELEKAVPDNYNLKIKEQGETVKLISNKYVKYLSLLVLAMLFIVGILLASGARKRVKTASTFFIIAGVVVVAMWYVASSLPVSYITTLAGPDVSVYLINIVEDLAMVILVRFAELFRAQGFWLLGIGIVLLIGSFFIPKPFEAEKEAKEDGQTAQKLIPLDKQ